MSTQHLSAEKLTCVINLASVVQSDKNPDRGELGVQRTVKELSLTDYIDALSDDEKSELLAVMWIGRGDGAYSPSEFVSAVADARAELEDCGSYMTGKPLVEYLRNGRKLLGV